MKKQFLLFALLFILFLVLPGAYEKFREYLRRQNGDGLLPFSVPSQRNSRQIEPQPAVKHGFTMPFYNRLNAALAFIKKIEDETKSTAPDEKHYGLSDIIKFCEAGENDPEIFQAILNNRYGVSDFCRGWSAVALGYLNDGSYTSALVNAYKSETSDTVRLAVLQGFLKIADASATYVKNGLTYDIALRLPGEPSGNISSEALNCFVDEVGLRKSEKKDISVYLIEVIAPVQKNYPLFTFKLIEIVKDDGFWGQIRLAAADALAYSQHGIGIMDLEQIIRGNSDEDIDPEFDPESQFHEAVLAAKALFGKADAGDEIAQIECKKLLLSNLPASVKKELLRFGKTGDITVDNLPVLFSLLKDPSPETRETALNRLYFSGKISDDWEPIIQDAIYNTIRKENDPKVKAELMACITGERESRYPDDDAEFFIEMLIGNEEDDVKKQAIESLVAMKCRKALAYIEDVMQNAPSEKLREAAEDAVFEINESDQESKAKLAVIAESLQNPADISGVRKMLDDAPPIVNEYAIGLLSALNPEQEAVLLGIFSDSDSQRLRSVALVHLIETSSGFPVMEQNKKYSAEALKSDKTPDEFKINVFDVLPSLEIMQIDGRIVSDFKGHAVQGYEPVDNGFMDNFMYVLKNDKSIEVKKATLNAFKKVYADKKSVEVISEELKELMEDDEYSELKPDIQKAINWLKYNSGQ